MSDELELDQEDFKALLDGDADFTNVTVLKEYKGDIESDIEQALATLNEKAGKLGALAVVLQPVELPSEADTPNPELRVRLTVQVFDEPLLNQGDTATGKDVWQLSRRVRQLGHRRSFGRGLYSWVGTEDAPQANPGRRSRVVTFEKRAHETRATKEGVIIEPESGATPIEVTITPTAGATARYTLDGTYPGPTATAYVAPFQVLAAATLRVVAYKAGSDPSDVAEVTFT